MNAARLSVLTWNVFLMPRWTFQSPHNLRRAKAVAQELLKLDYDILCLEKVFDNRARRALDQALSARYPYRYGPANPGCGLRINSGVWLASRIPLDDYREIVFRDSAGIEKFARKGAMLLTGSVAGHRFQVLATHLQGDDGPRYRPAHQEVRNRQMTQIRTDLLERYADPDASVIVCGDFSTPRPGAGFPALPGEGYAHMLSVFEGETGPDFRVTLDDSSARNDMAGSNTGRTAEVDYVILLPGSSSSVRGEWTRHVLRRRGWDGSRDRQDLSYRYAVGAVFWFDPPRIGAHRKQ